ncbi:hypothetical protein PAXINDRAFT_90077, partial [Paxillus involutus ATCC 200175]
MHPPRPVTSPTTSWPLPATSSSNKERNSSKRRKSSKFHVHRFTPPFFTRKPQTNLLSVYPSNLTPLPSPLRPHCTAKDRLILWLPANTRTLAINSTLLDPSRIQDILIQTWADSTRESYGSGLLAFHVFCDAKGIPDFQRAPAHSDLISVFIAYLAGSYSGKTISNYVCGVRAWHILHGQVWSLND